MNITYHKWKAFTECPKKFYLGYIKKAPPTVPQNDYFMLYGKLVEKFFQFFCNMWRFNTPYMSATDIKSKLEPIYPTILRTSTVIWTAPMCKQNEEEIFGDALRDICLIMDSPNQNYFLNTTSEVSIDLSLKNAHRLNGRIDFIHRDAINSNIESIIDGKGSSKIGKNVDDDQLLFYVLLYYFQYKKLPDSVGFFYYRYNTFVPVLINKDIINSFRAKLSLDIKTITTLEEYKATPSPKACLYCKYAQGCMECLQDRGTRAKKSKIDNLDDSTGDVITFGF